jgi:hypothetical protein
MAANVPRGFFRLWLIMSLAWFVGVGVDLAVAMIHISANAPNPFEQLYPELLAPPSLFVQTLWLAGLFAGPPAAVLLLGYWLGRMRA